MVHSRCELGQATNPYLRHGPGECRRAVRSRGAGRLCHHHGVGPEPTRVALLRAPGPKECAEVDRPSQSAARRPDEPSGRQSRTRSNIRSQDLVSVPVLRALLQERSVTRAADIVGLSQPAVSNALARLRRRFGDDLLERVGREYRLTPLGDRLTETDLARLPWVAPYDQTLVSSSPPVRQARALGIEPYVEVSADGFLA